MHSAWQARARAHALPVPLLLALALGLISAAAAAGRCSRTADGRLPAFNVLAVGDSLTKGAVPSRNMDHPYTLRLQQLLQQRLAGQFDVRVHTAGTSSAGTIVPGTDEQGRSITLGPLLLRELDRGRSQGTTYQWVLINGGINDLGRGNRTAEQVAPLLRDMYELAMRRGAEVVAILPWPNRFVAQSSKNEAERQRLLRGIQQYASNHDRSVQSGNGGGAKGGAPRMWVDATALTEFDFWGRPDARRFQDDLLHLNAAGYDLLGERVFGTMLPGLQRSIQRLCGSGSSCAGG